MTFARKHWRKGVVLVALGGCFAAGRLTAPKPRVETRIEERVEYKDRIVEVEKVVEVQAEAKRVVVYRDRVVKPDGTSVEREVETTESASTSTKAADRATELVAEAKAERETRVVEGRPEWRATALVGLDAPEVRPVGGLMVERRIIGGISAGVWGLSSLAVGLAVSVEF